MNIDNNNRGAKAWNFAIVILISFIWALFSGLLWFAGYGSLMSLFGVEDITEDFQRLILYTLIFFLSGFLIAFNRNKDKEYV